MNSARAWLTPIVRNFLSLHRLFFWECPGPDSITSRSLPQRKRWLFGTGSTRSIPAGLSMEAAALRPFSNEKDSLWEEPASRPPCGKWESKGSTPGPTLASGLWNTRSIPIFFAMFQPSIRTISGESTLPISDFSTAGCTSWPSSTGIPGLSSPGNWTRPWRCHLSWTPWIGPFRPLLRPFSIVTRDLTSPATAISSVSFPGTSRSAWMRKAEPRTIFSRNGSGEA